MMQLDQHELVFSFPQVADGAVLRIHFRRAEAPDEIVPLVPKPVNGGFLLSGCARVVMHLRPHLLAENYRYPSWMRFPFAVLLSVGGMNALTGRPWSAGLARPQNYFVTPPQGGIDGYFADGQVHPFYVCGEAGTDQMPLRIQVFPMKAEAFCYLSEELRFTAAPVPWGDHFLLPNCGERQCEPVYEDVCCIGDWDTGAQQQATVWLHGPR